MSEEDRKPFINEDVFEENIKEVYSPDTPLGRVVREAKNRQIREQAQDQQYTGVGFDAVSRMQNFENVSYTLTKAENGYVFMKQVNGFKDGRHYNDNYFYVAKHKYEISEIMNLLFPDDKVQD